MYGGDNTDGLIGTGDDVDFMIHRRRSANRLPIDFGTAGIAVRFPRQNDGKLRPDRRQHLRVMNDAGTVPPSVPPTRRKMSGFTR